MNKLQVIIVVMILLGGQFALAQSRSGLLVQDQNPSGLLAQGQSSHLVQSLPSQRKFIPAYYPFITSLEGEVQLGFGGGVIGVMGKANHRWIEGNGFSLVSGLSLSSFAKSESYSNPPTQIKGASYDTHLRLHTGGTFRFLRNYKAMIGLEAYGGIYHFRTRGTYSQTDLGIDREYKTSKLVGDFGSRLFVGYWINYKWAIQLSLTNSWKQAAFGLGWPVGLLAGEPDGKTSVGLGIRYRFPDPRGKKRKKNKLLLQDL